MLLKSIFDFAIDDSYLERELQRVRQNVFKTSKHLKGFDSRDTLAQWWLDQLKKQQGCCNYCQTPIRMIEKLIDAGVLEGRRTKGEGKRGPYLELERVDHKTGEYSPNNCVLICYYCNNDKSSVYPKAEYVQFFAPAKNRHFLFLFEKLKQMKAEAA